MAGIPDAEFDPLIRQMRPGDTWEPPGPLHPLADLQLQLLKFIPIENFMPKPGTRLNYNMDENAQALMDAMRRRG